MMRYIIAISILLLSGCSDRYRYKCQDPNNWDLDECKPPLCKASGVCAEDLIKTLNKNPCGIITDGAVDLYNNKGLRYPENIDISHSLCK